MTTASAAEGSGIIVAGIEHSAGSLAATVRRAFDRYRAYRATIVELRGLTDRQLHDVGMRRAEINGTALRAVYEY